MNEQAVVDLMKSSRSEAEWNANCLKVRAAFSGNYPDFWYPVIFVSGVGRDTLAKFGKSDKIHVTDLETGESL